MLCGSSLGPGGFLCFVCLGVCGVCEKICFPGFPDLGTRVGIWVWGFGSFGFSCFWGGWFSGIFSGKNVANRPQKIIKFYLKRNEF